MTLPKASRTRLQIRHSVGYNIGAIIVGESTSTVDSSSLIDVLFLVLGGDDEYNARQVQINVPTGSIVAGEQSFVSDFDGSAHDATMSPVFTASITDGDTYEMWKQSFLIQEINEKINQAIIAATDDILVDKVDTALVKETGIYEYTIPSGFVALHQIEYEYSIKIDHSIHNADAVWDELVDGDVAASADTAFKKEGSASLKLVVAAGAGANDILATDDITSLDIADSDTVSAWFYSTTAQASGDLQILLDDTAQCASPVESLDVPAITANTWTHVTISLANPQSDSAIISVGIKMITDNGAYTLWVDDIRAYKADSIVYRQLNPDLWNIVQGSTNKLKLTEVGYSAITNNKRLRLSGYAIPAVLSADSTTCDIDPDYVIAKTTALMMMSRGGQKEVDPDDYNRRADKWSAMAERRLIQSRTPLSMNLRWVS